MDPMDAQATVVAEDVQVAAKPRRRTYTAEYKRRILQEADACATPGAVGALLRREGLYSSHLVEWRKVRDKAATERLSRKRWRKPRDAGTLERERLERENARLVEKLRQAEIIIDVQKKVAALLGIPLPKDDET